MLKRISCILSFVLLSGLSSFAQQTNTSFKIVPLGVKGGDDESNLSAYLLAPLQSDNYIALDAGTIHAGIQKAIQRGIFKGSTQEVLKKQVKAYLISHAHLDHLAGLIINSPADSSKNIYSMPKVLNIIRDKYFTWDAWANFANEGEKPQLKKYTYTPLEEDKSQALDGTEMTVQAYTLSHGNPYQSTAFLLKANESYVLYLGDTGADEIEKSDRLKKLWQKVAPLVNSGQLKAIFLEVSFPNEQPENQLFGHLTPKLFFKELQQLQQLTETAAFRKLSFIVTHRKPPIYKEERIKKQLKAANNLNLKLIFPEQGRMLIIN